MEAVNLERLRRSDAPKTACMISGSVTATAGAFVLFQNGLIDGRGIGWTAVLGGFASLIVIPALFIGTSVIAHTISLRLALRNR
jgi:hypothetical protein